MKKTDSSVPTRIVMVIVLIFILTAAGSPATAHPSQALGLNPYILRVSAGPYPDSLDPFTATFVNSIGHLKLIYEGLTRLDSSLVTVPGAAESWEYNLDGTQITLTLRADLSYSDGSPLNALRYEYAILRAIDPRTGGDYASILNAISGAEAFLSADPDTLTEEELLELRDAVAVEALTISTEQPCTDYTQVECRVLRIGLDHPAPYFHTILSLWVTYPAKQELIEADGDGWWQDPANHVGNGPFVVTRLDPALGSTFTANAHYWAGTAGYDIRFQYISDPLVALQAYQADQLDIMPIGADITGTVNGDPTLSSEASMYAGACTFAVMYPNQQAPFDNRDIRAAFSYAIDRQAWADEILLGTGVPTLTWIPPGFPGYDADEDRWDYDPAAALQALEDSGYTVEDGKLVNPEQQVVDIVVNFSNTARNVARWTWLQQQWEDVLGVTVTLNPNTTGTNGPVYILGWCADYPDPQNWLSVYWKTGAFSARIGYSNLELDALLDEADATVDPVERMALYAEAQDMLVGDVPVTFLWNNIQAYLVKPRVHGEAGTPQDAIWMGDMDPLLITLDPLTIHYLMLPVVVK